MGNIIKYLLIALGLGSAVYLLQQGASTVSNWASQLSIKIKQFGKPILNNGKLSIPLVLQVINPTPLVAPVDSVQVKLFFLKSGMYQPFGEAPPTAPFVIQPNANTDVSIYPTIDVQKLNPFTGGQNILTQVNNIISGNNPLIDVKAEITIVVQGIDLVREATQKIYLTDFIRNVA